jgi:flagellar hook-length control protein FliK
VPEVFTPPGAEEALAEQVTYWVNQKTQNAEMTLTRDGQPVEVLVSLSGNEAHVTFRSDQEHTRQMLDGSMAQLSDMLRDQGLILTGSSVGTSAGDGKSSGGNASQERNSRAGQTKVAAAEGGGGQPRISQDGRSAIDVFV